MKADAQTEAEIKALLEEMWKRYAQKDLEGCLALWTDAPDLVAVGTGADEIRLGPEELRRGIKREFEQAESIKQSIEWLRISAARDVAWSTGNITLTTTVNDKEVVLPARQTNVYEKRNGAWRVIQLHLSLPAVDQAAGRSWK
ncbi:MAG: nuclear transport factor 2 family protein [Halobacteriota archaeon]